MGWYDRISEHHYFENQQMLTYIKKLSVPNRMQVVITYLLILGWLGFISWELVQTSTWVYYPVLVAFGYIALRLVFELTINRSSVPTLATCFIARQKIARILEHEASQSDKDSYSIVDLGSGRGELARCIAKRISKAKVTGIEMARFPYMQASLIQRLFGPKNLAFERRDFWQLDCSSIDAVVLYLGPLTAQQMGRKLRQELKGGSMVISHTYPLLGEWTPVDVLTFHAPFKETIYVYRQF